MSFRRAVLTFAACAATAALPGVPAWADNGRQDSGRQDSGRQIDGSYEITFAGFAGFRIDFTARFDANSYDVESHTFKTGMLKAITLHYEGRNRAWGSFGPQGAQPRAGSLSIVVERTARTWLAQYGAGGTLHEKNDPPWKPQPKDAIPDDKKLGSLDPLSATLAVGMKGDAACDQVAPSNDGKRRIDVVLKKVRTETPEQAGVPQAKGDLLVCELYSKRIAGEFYDAPEEAESQREHPMVLWLARIDDTPFRYPVKLEARTGFGTIRGKLLSLTERPLTDEEKVAMRR